MPIGLILRAEFRVAANLGEQPGRPRFVRISDARGGDGAGGRGGSSGAAGDAEQCSLMGAAGTGGIAIDLVDGFLEYTDSFLAVVDAIEDLAP